MAAWTSLGASSGSARRRRPDAPLASRRDDRGIEQLRELRGPRLVGAETLSHLDEIGQEVPRVAALRPQAGEGLVQRFGGGVVPGRRRALVGRITRLR